MSDVPQLDTPAPAAATTAAACVSCGTPLQGPWCHTCGEERMARVPTIGAFLRSAIRELTNLEGRGFRTFRALLERPGLLTREYLTGRHRPWLSPLQVFLIANLIFFVAVSFIGGSGLTTPLQSQLEGQFYSTWTRAALRSYFLGLESVDFDVFRARFDYASVQQAKTLVILMVPMFATLLWASRAWRREPPVQHLVFALQYISVMMLMYVGIWLLVRPLYLLAVLAETTDVRPGAAVALEPLFGDVGFTILMMVGLGSYLYLGLRTGYGDGRPQALTRAVVLAIATPVIMMAYRMILFFTVLYTI